MGEEQRDTDDAGARTAEPDQDQGRVKGPEDTSLLLHQLPHLQPPTPRDICCGHRGTAEAKHWKVKVFAIQWEWELSFSWFCEYSQYL